MVTINFYIDYFTTKYLHKHNDISKNWRRIGIWSHRTMSFGDLMIVVLVLYQIKYLQNKFDICHRQPAESSRFCAFKSKRGPQHLTAAAARLGPPQSPTAPWWPAAGWCRWRAAAAVPMWTSGRQPSVLCARGAAWGCWPLELCCAMLYAAADTKLLSRAHQLGLNHLHFYEKTYQRPLTPLGPGQVCSIV